MYAIIPTLFAAGEQPTGIAALGIDPLAILAQAVTFLVLFLLIKTFALKKIVATLDERRNTINRGLHLTTEMDKLKADLDQRVEMALKEARSEADSIIAEARVESGEIIRAAEEAATRKTDAMLADAEARIMRDITAAKQELAEEVAELVAEVSASILREKVTDSADRKLIDRYVKEHLS